MFSWLDRVRGRRDITFQKLWGSGFSMSDLTNVHSGVRVNESTVLGLNAAYACVSLLVDTVSTLPTGTFIRRRDERIPVPRPEWMFQPEAGNPSSTWETHIGEVMYSLLIDGNAFIFTLRSNDGELLEVRALDPSSVEPKQNDSGTVIYEVTRGAEKRILTSDEIRHVWRLRRPGTLRGLSPIESARQGLGKSFAAEMYGARFYGSGATLSGLIQSKGPVPEAEAKSIVKRFEARYGGVNNAFKVGMLDNGAEWKQLSVTPEQAQFLATLKHGVEDVARLFRVPPYMISAVEQGAASYASVAQRSIDFEKFTIRPYIEALEAVYRPLLPPGVFLGFNTKGLLRSDFKTRMDGYAVGIQNGFMSVNDVRRLEDFPPAPGPGADAYRQQMQMRDINAPTEDEQEQEIEAA